MANSTGASDINHLRFLQYGGVKASMPNVKVLLRSKMAAELGGVAVTETATAQAAEPGHTAVTESATAEAIDASLKHYRSYLLTGSLDDVDQAVHCARNALQDRSQRLKMKIINTTVLNLGRSLLRRFQRTRQPEDVMEAIESFQRVLYASAPGNFETFRRSLDYLSIAFLERDGNFDGLLQIMPAAHIRGTSVETISRHLGEDVEVLKYFLETINDIDSRNASFHPPDYPVSARMAHIDAAIRISREALGYFAFNCDICWWILCVLGQNLMQRFMLGNETEDIDEAVESFCVGQELSAPDNLDYWRWQRQAGMAYFFRYRALRRRDDLDSCLRLAKQTIEVFETQYPELLRHRDFALCLTNLAIPLLERFHAEGNVIDLYAAIEASGRAVEIGDPGDLAYVDTLNMLQLCVSVRYHSTGARRAEDLAEQNRALRGALAYWPSNHPQRMEILRHLCIHELEQGAITQEPECLNRARDYLQDACFVLEMNPEEKRWVGSDFYYDLGHFLYRYSLSFPNDVPLDLKQFGVAESGGLDAAIRVARIGASLEDGIYQSKIQLLLSDCLYQRGCLRSQFEDINEAIIIARSAVEHRAVGGRFGGDSVIAQTKLGQYLGTRYKSTGDTNDLEEALSVLLEGFQISGGQTRAHMRAGRMAIEMLVEKGDWDNASKLTQKIVDIFVILNSRSQAWPNKEHMLGGFVLGANMHFAIALEAGAHVFNVIDTLEAFRGSILGHHIDKQADLTELTEAAPAKAELFKTLQDEISTEIESTQETRTRVKEITRRIEAEEEICACLKDIRNVEGFHQFLRGPTETELKAAAIGGPVVIVNVAPWRSDAIIITKDATDLLPLTGMKEETLQMYIGKGLTDVTFQTLAQNNKEFRGMLEWLWQNCVKLIFDKLRDFGYGPAKFRVCWTGVGIASSLPFHAAGKYMGKDCVTALSQAISSYTPTLRMLIHSQRKLKADGSKPALQHPAMKRQIVGNAKPRLTLITMPSTPGWPDLEGVQQEAREIQDIVGETFATKQFVQPSSKEALSYMAESDIVHFACHGESHVVDPSSSHLLLQDRAPNSSSLAVDKLTLKDAADADLHHGKLAFLSACSTAQNRNEYLQDEMLHLVSGFQAAGYLHAIGNLWPSDDEMTVKVVKEFYSHLVAAGDFGSGDNIAEALNKAMLNMARKYPKQPLAWAQFVHFGI